MNPFIRNLSRFALAASLCAAASLPAPAQTATPSTSPSSLPVPTHTSTVPMIPGGPPTVMPAPGSSPNSLYPAGSATSNPQILQLPKFLEGVITLDEYRAYQKFQQSLSDDPAIKDLNTRIIAQVYQLRLMQAEMSKLRMKANTDNPEMKAIGDKMQQAMRAHTQMPMMSGAPTPAPSLSVPMARPPSPPPATTPAPEPKS